MIIVLSFLRHLVHSDADVANFKGKVVLDYEERKSILSHIRWVDEIVDDAPWYPTLEWMEQHQIDFVVGDEHAYEQYAAVPFRPVREAGRFIPIAREEGALLAYCHFSLGHRWPFFQGVRVMKGSLDHKS